MEKKRWNGKGKKNICCHLCRPLSDLKAPGKPNFQTKLLNSHAAANRSRPSRTCTHHILYWRYLYICTGFENKEVDHVSTLPQMLDATSNSLTCRALWAEILQNILSSRNTSQIPICYNSSYNNTARSLILKRAFKWLWLAFGSPRFLYFSLLRPELSYFCPTTEIIDLGTKFLEPSKQHMDEKKRPTWISESLISYTLSDNSFNDVRKQALQFSFSTFPHTSHGLSQAPHITCLVSRICLSQTSAPRGQNLPVGTRWARRWTTACLRWGPLMAKLTLAVFSPAFQTNRFNAPLHHFTLK